MNLTTGTVALDVTFEQSSPPAGTVFLVPRVGADGRVTWTCKSEPSFRKFTPRSCRDQ